LGALTAPLLEQLNALTVIELDRDLAARLRQRFSETQLPIVQADVLTVDFSQFGNDLRIVGNLPYNISSPLLFSLVEYADHVVDQHFMLQREVVDRMVAEPGSGDYSRLSVMLQYRYAIEKIFDVAPEAFDPAPRVTSSVVRMVPLAHTRARALNEPLFAAVVLRAFSQRRKMLRGVLGAWTPMIPWETLQIEPTWRAEQVSVPKFIALANALHARGVKP
jgi:16S rRNA (adenine1518-N6/adenine1519-N6)-dimethyltransferase